jgi:hypothetical protein
VAYDADGDGLNDAVRIFGKGTAPGGASTAAYHADSQTLLRDGSTAQAWTHTHYPSVGQPGPSVPLGKAAIVNKGVNWYVATNAGSGIEIWRYSPEREDRRLHGMVEARRRSPTPRPTT